MINIHRKILAFALCLIALTFTASATAGGASAGPGIVSSNESSTDFSLSRHERGLDYAFSDPDFIAMLEEVVLEHSLATGGVPPNVTDIILEMKSAYDLVDYSKQSTIDYKYINEVFRSVLETSLIPVKASVPGFSSALSTLKLATSFTTSYTYGFFWGR